MIIECKGKVVAEDVFANPAKPCQAEIKFNGYWHLCGLSEHGSEPHLAQTHEYKIAWEDSGVFEVELG